VQKTIKLPVTGVAFGRTV